VIISDIPGEGEASFSEHNTQFIRDSDFGTRIRNPNAISIQHSPSRSPTGKMPVSILNSSE
jgi:hypothetical protein